MSKAVKDGIGHMISIIVPVYNTIKYLPKCIDSILSQTVKELELILVDDGSSDGSGKLCDDYAKKDPRVRVFHKKNGGSSSARNLGIRNAVGDYIGFIDSDDWADPDMYELLLDGIKRNNVKCAQIGRDEIDENGNKLPDICIPPDKEELIGSRDFLRELLMHRGDCSFCTKLIAREIFEKEEEFFPVGVLNEDFHILIKKLPEMGDILSLPGHKYHVLYRLGSNSRKKTKAEFSRVFADNVDNADMAEKLVKERYPQDTELEKTAFRFGIFQRLDYLLHIPVDMMKKPDREESVEKNADEGKRDDGRNKEKVYAEYRRIVRYIRNNYFKAVANPYLTAKNKLFVTLFATAPRGIRHLHRRLKGIS